MVGSPDLHGPKRVTPSRGNHMGNVKAKDLSSLVNASGFAFQLTVEHLVRSSHGHHWRVVSREHPWRDPATGAEGFIDLVLQSGAVTWVIECKRTRGASWVFLVESDKPEQVDRCRCLWVVGHKSGRCLAGWDDIHQKPDSTESSFCVIRGSGEAAPPLLERIASRLLLATDCLAEQEVRLLTTRSEGSWGVYAPVIVTTAALHVSRIDPRVVSIHDGTVSALESTRVPLVRFRKAFLTREPPRSTATTLGQAAVERERTVLVVSAEALTDVLKSAKILRDEWSDQWPWSAAVDELSDVLPPEA